MDLDALGLNSTFESTELDGSYEPPIDRVETSDIEGPEDFTMNMTYWMTADLPLAQIKSRKEAKMVRSEVRMDATQENLEEPDTTGEGDQAIVVEETSSHRNDHSAPPTMRANSPADAQKYSSAASERSMGNDEKVRSFLSALPDTDMEGALTGTPMHIPKQSFLQVPRSSPPKARSLQPTVEDYDTPRKPTQETVIHHKSPIIDTSGQDAIRNQILELQSRLEQQQLVSKTRITELETILAYTREELEGTRSDNYRHKEKLAALKLGIEQQNADHEASRLSAEAELKTREDASSAKMQEFSEEMRLQNLAKLQAQREDHDRQLRALQESKRLVDEELDAKAETLEQVQEQLLQLRQSNEQELQDKRATPPQQERADKDAVEGYGKLAEQLSSVQTRADSLHSQLEKATAEARVARETAQRKDATHAAAESRVRDQTIRISDLEGHLRTARFELECAQADVAAKQQLFQTNLDLNSRVRQLQSELDTTRTHLSSRDQQSPVADDVESRISSIHTQLESTRRDLLSKDQQILRHIESQEQSNQVFNISKGRIEGLEATVSTLRQQLAEALREGAKARTDTQRLEQDLEDANERIQDAHADANRRVADLERKLAKMKESKLEAGHKLNELQAQHEDLIEGHEAVMEDVREKAEDAVRKAGALLEQERSEKRRLMKDLKQAKQEIVKLRDEATQKSAEEEYSDDESVISNSRTAANAKDVEIIKLRDIIRKQVADMKTVKAEAATLRKENKKLRSIFESSSDLQSTIEALEIQLDTLRTQNSVLQSRLDAQQEDVEAVNKAMDERLAAMLSKILKERAKTVVGKRDGQWVESVGKVQTEKEMLGKVLLRQWGREEVGVADEKHGERQGYAYKYVKRNA